MYEGIILAAATGIILSGVGIIMSHCAHADMDYISYAVIQSLITILFTTVFYVRFDVIAAGMVMRSAPLVLALAGAGFIGIIGLVTMQSAMKRGHHGIIWVIGQSSLVIPFLSGWFIFGEDGSLARALGVALILAGMLLPLIGEQDTQTAGDATSGGKWWKLALVAFLVIGIGQTLQSLPSYWHGWQDTACVRPALGWLGNLLGICACAMIRRHHLRPDRRTVLIALGMGAVSTVNSKLFYTALDRLATYGMAAIGFPLAVGVCIIVFSLYSLLIIREHSHPLQWLGLSATLAGIFVMAH